MSRVIRRVVDEIEHTRRNRAGKSRVDDREEAERETPSVGIFDYNDEFETYSIGNDSISRKMWNNGMFNVKVSRYRYQ